MLIFLMACKGDPEPIPLVQLFPADGQTDVSTVAPLILQGFGLNYPDGAPVPSLAELIDLDRNELVPGELALTDVGMEFRPDDPLAAGTDFALNVRRSLEETRRPQLLPPDEEGEPIEGMVRFTTTADARPLSLFTEDGEFCVVASQPLLPSDLMRVELQTTGARAPAPTLRLIEPEIYELSTLSDSDRGLGVACGALPFDIPPERVWIGENSILGSGEGVLDDIVRALRLPR